VRLDCVIFIISSPVRTSTWLCFLLHLTRLDLAFDESRCLGRYCMKSGEPGFQGLTG
jgi:hypothetical protein